MSSSFSYFSLLIPGRIGCKCQLIKEVRKGRGFCVSGFVNNVNHSVYSLFYCMAPCKHFIVLLNKKNILGLQPLIRISSFGYQ